MTRLVWGGVALWLVVVGCGAGLAWFAINEAGRGIGTKHPAYAVTALPTINAAPTTAATAGGSTSPTTRPSASRSTRPASTPTVGTTPTAPLTQVRTWTGTPGSITVACTGYSVDLRSASPANGWRVERDEVGQGVGVKFERGDVTVVVGATCSQGEPRFRVASDD